MADDLEKRVTRIEMNFDEYMAMFYKWLDELRTDMKDLRGDMKDVKSIMQMLAENDGKIIETQRRQEETQGMLIHLLNKLDEKFDTHEGRLNAAGI